MPLLELLVRPSRPLTLCSVPAGRLIGYVEPHINSYDCLGALAVIDGAGGKISGFLANDGLRKGSRVIAGSAALYPALEALLGEGNEGRRGVGERDAWRRPAPCANANTGPAAAA